MASDKPSESELQRMREERAAIFDRIYAFYDIKILSMAIESGLFEEMAEASKSVSELASACSLPDRSVRGLLISLGAMGLVSNDSKGYRATPKARSFFLKESPTSMISALPFAEWQFDALPRLRETIFEGKVIWDGFDHYLHNLETEADRELALKRQKMFNDALAGSATATGKTVLGNVDFSQFKKVLDIGGNLGVFSSTILQKHPHLTSTVFDLPQVVPQTAAEVAKRGLSDRIGTVGGDFVADPWPKDADLVTFIRILATRSREGCVHLLRKAYDALPSGGHALFYEEHVLGRDRNAIPKGAAWASMFVMIGSLGEVRHVDDWTGMFEEAGFREIKEIVGNPWGIVIGKKIG